MRKMRWKFIYCLLLVSCITVSLSNERPKRDLRKLKNIIKSILMKWKPIKSNYKPLDIPGQVLVKDIPKHTNKVSTIFKDESTNEMVKALEDIKKLLELGILNDKSDRVIQKIIIPMFQSPPIKFSSTEVTKRYSVKPPNTLIEVPEQIFVEKPPIEVNEVISIVPDNTKYSYKQTTHADHAEASTFVSKNNPNIVLNQTKNVPRQKMFPHYIKARIQEVPSMGVNPPRTSLYVSRGQHAFKKLGAEIAARSPLLVEETIKVPSVLPSINIIEGAEAIDIYESPIVANGVNPIEFQPVLAEETVRVPTVPIALNRPYGLTMQPFFNSSNPSVLVEETVGLPATFVARPPLLVEESYITAPKPEVIDVVSQPMIGGMRPPIVVSDTVQVPAYPSQVVYNSLIETHEHTLPMLLKETENNSNINPVETVNINDNTANNADYYGNRATKTNINQRIEVKIPPPPYLQNEQNNNKTSVFSYRLIYNKDMNKSMDSANDERPKLRATPSNISDVGNKGTDITTSKEVSIPSSFEDTDKSHETIYDLVSRNQNSSTLNKKANNLTGPGELSNRIFLNDNKTTLELSSFIPKSNETKSGSHSANSNTIYKNISQIPGSDLDNKKEHDYQKFIFTEAQNDKEKNVIALDQHNTSTTAMLTNTVKKLIKHKKKKKYIIRRGDIPSPSSSEEETEMLENNNDAKFLNQTNSSKFSLGIGDSQIVSSFNIGILPPSTSNSSSNKNNKSNREHIKFIRQVDPIADGGILGTNSKENITSVPTLLSISDTLVSKSQKIISGAFNESNSSPAFVLNDSLNTIHVQKTKTKIYNNNESELNITLPPVISTKNSVNITDNIDLILSSTQTSPLASSQLEANVNDKIIKNYAFKFEPSLIANDATEKNITNYGDYVDQELKNLNINRHPIKTFTEAQGVLKQIENRFDDKFETINKSVKSDINTNLTQKEQELNSGLSNTPEIDKKHLLLNTGNNNKFKPKVNLNNYSNADLNQDKSFDFSNKTTELKNNEIYESFPDESVKQELNNLTTSHHPTKIITITDFNQMENNITGNFQFINHSMELGNNAIKTDKNELLVSNANDTMKGIRKHIHSTNKWNRGKFKNKVIGINTVKGVPSQNKTSIMDNNFNIYSELNNGDLTVKTVENSPNPSINITSENENSRNNNDTYLFNTRKNVADISTGPRETQNIPRLKTNVLNETIVHGAILDSIGNISKTEERLKPNLKNRYFSKRTKFPLSNAMSENKSKDPLPEMTTISTDFSDYKSGIKNRNISETFKLNNQRRSGIIIGSKRKQTIALGKKKDYNNSKQDNKFALNSSRKAAINRLLGRNETSNIPRIVAKDSTSSVTSQKKITKTSRTNRVVINRNKSTVADRNKRDVNEVLHRIPQHYLYVPPLDVDLPPPITPTGSDKGKTGTDNKSEALKRLKNSYLNNITINNPLFVMNGNRYIF